MQRGHATVAAERHDGDEPAVGLYQRDFRAWALEQARVLHQAGESRVHGDAEAFREAAAALDYANLSEELASLGRSESRELRSRLTTVVEHLLKAQHSPAAGPRAGWRNMVRRTRRDVARLLRDSPSLKAELPDLLGEAAEDALALVPADMEDRGEGEAGELAAAMREALRDYTPERVLDPDWWPPMARGRPTDREARRRQAGQDMTCPRPRPEADPEALEQRLRAEAFPPPDPFMDALEAYRTKFGTTPTIMGLSSTRYPDLAAELRAAVRDGVPRSDGDIRRALGMGSPPPGAEL